MLFAFPSSARVMYFLDDDEAYDRFFVKKAANNIITSQ
jgi:hypothetical protein